MQNGSCRDSPVICAFYTSKLTQNAILLTYTGLRVTAMSCSLMSQAIPPEPSHPGASAPHSVRIDTHLMQAAQAGDDVAFETLFQRYQAKVYRQAWSLLGDDADAEEVTQEVFLTLHRKALTFRGASAFSTWLYRVTANAALSRLRWRRRQTVSLEQVATTYGASRLHAPAAEYDAIRAESRAYLRQALEALRPLDQAIVVLSDLEGLTNRETGHVLGLSLSAVKARRYRAHQALKIHLTKRLDPTSSHARSPWYRVGRRAQS